MGAAGWSLFRMRAPTSLDIKMFQVWLKEPPVPPLLVALPKHGGVGRPEDRKLDRFDL